MSIIEKTTPDEIKALSKEDREKLADEIREVIISIVTKTGGHLASSLGVVELTLAILSVYDPMVDKIIWDVGHQSYPWKILTGRLDEFRTIRQKGGLSGFPRRDESPYDVFGTGHSSTSISAALGFALSRDLLGGSEKVVAVIGDGAMTGGMAFEALNHLGDTNTDMLIILNDNDMSISLNVGAISSHLTRLITDPRYQHMKASIWNALFKLPLEGKGVRKATHALTSGLKKTLISSNTVFDDFGVRYIGPVPGHNLPVLTETLRRVARLPGPILLHVVTQKGKGYDPAEKDATKYHGISPSEPKSGTPRTFTQAFTEAMVNLAETDDRIVAITAAMPDGTGLVEFSGKYPERFFDVGIAEQHAVTLACGLAFGGLKPVVAIYSTFFQRAVDQVIHDAALQKAPIVLALDRGGVVGEDGATHHGVFDISILLSIPGMRLIAPRSGFILEKALKIAVDFEEYPTAVRYPRGSDYASDIPEPGALTQGRGQVLSEGTDVLLIGVGIMAAKAYEAAGILAEQNISATVYDPIWLKPAPIEEIIELAEKCGKVVTIEDGSVIGGFGVYVCSILQETDIPVVNLGIPDEFQTSATQDELYRMMKIDAEGIAERTGEFLAKE